MRVRAGLAAVVIALPFWEPIRAGAEQAAADGLWRTEPRPNGGYLVVRIGPCDEVPEQRCGTVAGARAGARPDIVGEPILRGMKRLGPSDWADGEIIRPGEGTVYRSRMRLADEDSLEVRGCALGGLVCGRQVWTRLR